MFARMTIHAANLINLYEIGSDGRVPYQRLKGRKLQTEMLEFRKRVHFQPLDHAKLGKAELRWTDGMYLGVRLTSGEKLVANGQGVFKVRSIRRRLEAERWDVDHINAVNSFPWKPYEGSEDDRILIRPPIATVPKNLTEEAIERSGLGDPTPRPFAIQRRDIINYGYTPGCPGCYAAANDRKYRPHTNECRGRIVDAMATDDIGDNRVKATRERENAWLEKQVREGEVPAAASRSVPTPPTPHAESRSTRD